MAKQKQILVVDDDKNLVKVLKVVLTKAGHRVFTAYDGEQALERIKRVIPDLIVLDMMMPKMNGIELARHLLAFMSGGHIPIIFLTVKRDKEDVEKAYKSGADWYLAKPFNREELLTAVNVLLNLGYFGGVR